MTEKKALIKDKAGNIIYPQTQASLVIKGVQYEDLNEEIEANPTNLIEEWQAYQQHVNAIVEAYQQQVQSLQAELNEFKTTGVDGEWVTDIVQLLSSAGTLSQVTIDLSNYLPKDGFDYQVKFKLAGYDNDSTFGYYIDTDKWVTSQSAFTTDDGNANPTYQLFGGTYSRQNTSVFDLPVGTGRWARISGFGADNVYVNALGFRRLAKKV